MTAEDWADLGLMFVAGSRAALGEPDMHGAVPVAAALAEMSLHCHQVSMKRLAKEQAAEAALAQQEAVRARFAHRGPHGGGLSG
jgi:hypothetical protein